MRHPDEIIVLNLPDAIERRWASIGALASNQYCDRDKIHIWQGVYVNNYLNTKEIIGDARIDGFPFLKTSYERGDLQNTTYDMCIAAQAWSYMQVLRYIKENGNYTVFLYDDYCITDFFLINHLTEWLSGEDDFLFMNLADHYLIPDYNADMERRAHPRIGGVVEGPACNEGAILFSPKGADFFSNYVSENFYKSMEHTLTRMQSLPREERRGVWKPVHDIAREMTFLSSTVHLHNDPYTFKNTSRHPDGSVDDSPVCVDPNNLHRKCAGA